MSAPYRDYSYPTDAPSGSHDYLLAPLLRLLGPPEGAVLDLGCGNGALVRELLQRGHDSYGVDASASGIAIADGILPGRFQLLDLANGDWPAHWAGRRFRTVISTEVIEHLYAPAALLEIAASVLEPGGNLILSTPYHGYLKNLCLAVAGRMDFHFTALWDGGHIKFFSRATLTELLSRNGFAVSHFQGVGRVPWLWKSMLFKAHLATLAAH